MTVRNVPMSAAALAALACAAPLLAAPVNDARTSAIVVTVGNSYAGTTAASTNEGGLAGACGNSATSGDVWYRFDCTSDTGVQVTTCGAASYDTVLQAFNVGAGNSLGSSIACQDDDSSCAGNRSTISFGAVAGNSYWIRVAGWQGATGTFTIGVTATVPPPPPPTRSTGPDVTVGNLYDIATYGTGSVWKADSSTVGSVTGMRSYAVGTDSWNIGDIPVEWQASNQRHPVIGQQMYRYKDGRFEQIGISWLKHGFASTNSGAFPDMGACDSPPSGGAQLGINCSDLYDSGLNGGRSYLGPRFDVNGNTGVYTYPWNTLVGNPAPSDPVSRRLVVADSDVAAASNPGAEYYVDCQYITQDDAQWNNGRNNFSTRKLTSSVQTAPAFATPTTRRTTALEYWAAEKMAGGDAAINLADVSFHERSMSVTDKWQHWTEASPNAVVLTNSSQWTTFTSPIQGRFLVASRVIENAGVYSYEYAVLNVNSHRAGGSFSVRLPAGATASNVGFHAPVYHSGDRFLNNPWDANGGAGGKMAWTVNPATANVQVPGMTGTRLFGPNALVWGSLYNFRFTTSAAPEVGTARIGLFRAPTDATGFQGSMLAIDSIKVPAVCTADMGSQGGITAPDGALDNNDFVAFIDAFFNSDMLMADIGKQGGLAGADNALDNNDFIVFIDEFFAGCGA